MPKQFAKTADRSFLRDAGLLSVFFLFVLWLDTRLVYLVTQPAFQMRRAFIGQILRRRGGVAGISASVFGQFFYSRLAGALMLTALAALLLLLSGRVVRRLAGGSGYVARYLPLVILTAMAAGVIFTLEPVFASLLLLLAALFYAYLTDRLPAPVRAAVLFFLSMALYFGAVGSLNRFRWFGLDMHVKLENIVFLVVWMLLCLALEMRSAGVSDFRDISARLLMVAAATISGAFVVEYFSPHPPEGFRIDYPVFHFWQFIFALAMYASAGLAVLLALAPAGLRQSSMRGERSSPALSPRRWAGFHTGVLPFVLLSAAVLLPRWSPQPERIIPSHKLRRALQVHWLVRGEHYQEALNRAEKADILTFPLLHDINLALHETGRFLEHLMVWRHHRAVDSYVPLFMFHQKKFLSNYCYERAVGIGIRLGRIGNAEHVAYEMMADIRSPVRYRPDLYRHLALIHMVKDETEIARVYLNNLAADPLQRRYALHWLAMLDDDPGLEKSDLIMRLRARMLPEDDVEETVSTEGVNVSRQLINLLERDPANRMALDYLLATYMDAGFLPEIADAAGRLPAAGYRSMPSLVQQALLTYEAQGNELPEDVSRGIDPYWRSAFKEADILTSRLLHDYDEEVAEYMRQQFKGTYWFYRWQQKQRR